MTAARNIEVRLARANDEIDAAQRLRYTVFYDEWGAHPDLRVRHAQRDSDEFDADMDHLIVIDHGRSLAEGQVVGNYRLQRGDTLGAKGRFYSSGEFDLGPLLDSRQRLLELGRSCVLREYRSMPILQLLWRAIVAYVAEHRIEVMFGCASLHGTDPEAVREQLAYLHHYHLAPPAVRPRALGPTRIPIDTMCRASVDVARSREALEPLIKGYLRQGACVGEGAYIDHQFNSIDICIVMPTVKLAARYLRQYEQAVKHAPVAATTAAARPDEMPVAARLPPRIARA